MARTFGAFVGLLMSLITSAAHASIQFPPVELKLKDFSDFEACSAEVLRTFEEKVKSMDGKKLISINFESGFLEIIRTFGEGFETQKYECKAGQLWLTVYGVVPNMGPPTSSDVPRERTR
ncbi:MAG: hypothetical protein ACK5SX_06585 [Sandaracinobacter sp.]